MAGAVDRLEISLLGPLHATVAGRPVAIRGWVERALLARLAIDANRPVNPSRIVDDLWGEDLPLRPKQALHASVFRLRRALGGQSPALETSEGGYLLRLEPDALDVWTFEGLVSRARRARTEGDARAALGHLTAALGLWRGEALAGLDDCAFVPARARQLEEARSEVLVERLGVELDLGHHAQLVPELEGLSIQRPTDERLAGLLMLALYRSERQAEALAVYDKLRKRLVDQIGIDPSHPLQHLELAILQQDPGLDWRAGGQDGRTISPLDEPAVPLPADGPGDEGWRRAASRPGRAGRSRRRRRWTCRTH